MYAYVMLEVRRTLRDGAFLIFGTGMPVLMYLLFTNIGDTSGGGSGADDWRAYSMTGMAAYGALGSAMSVGTGIASDKSLGWLKQLRITPLAPSRIVVGRALSGSVTVLPAVAGVLLAGALVNRIQLGWSQWVLLVALLWVGTLPFTLLGIGNGYRLTPQGTGVINIACMTGFAVIGGLWFPLDTLPGPVRAVGAHTPAHGFADLGWTTIAGQAPNLSSVAELLAWGALFGGYAVGSYRRAARTL
ncbi:ABC transporter permease [Streptomyces sp. NBC_00102]|uniref:ABC transporter permease n=1 Tax=Streptomyces sp. NBC_00102 TaxID=2975652 RepID=UPI002258F91D|nr:ABC transporter permease [Streptomyces sp. NBC_00102]MCX5396695.1 ABC transporter permease [Streptomyces sp. NBC_00102]